VLQCCQDGAAGGLRDKPGAYVDYFHSCYSLSGMSLAQNNMYDAARHGARPCARECARRRWFPAYAAAGGADAGSIGGTVVRPYAAATGKEAGAAQAGGAAPQPLLLASRQRTGNNSIRWKKNPT
jgi:protein farnesyltransferase subunit beta